MVPIPEGSESYSEESCTTEYAESQETLDQPTDLRGSGADPASEPPKIQGMCELSYPPPI